MKYFYKRRTKIHPKGQRRQDLIGSETNDPLTGVANLFDLGLVFIVGLIFTLFSAYHMQDLFDKNSELTIMKKTKSNQMEIITKKGKKIEARKVTERKASGKGVRLGTAYRLEDGTMVYVPD